MTSKSIVSLIHPADEWLSRRVILAGLFLAIASFYLLTVPANHSDAIDGYDYAHRAETLGLAKIDDTRSILYTLVNKLLYQASDALGLGLRALQVLIGFSIVTGAASVLLMTRLLSKGFGLSNVASWSGGAFLGLSYGFWRYTGEAEVYVPSIFLILGSLNLLFDALREEGQHWRSVIPAALLAGLAGLYYQPNVIPLFLAAPVLMLSRRRLPSLIAYGAIGSAVILGGIVAAYLVETGAVPTAAALIQFVTSRGEEFQKHPLSLATVLAMGQAILHTFFSLNWLFGIHEVTQSLQRLYPNNAITPKVFAAEHFRPFVYLAIPFLAFLIALVCWMSAFAVRNMRQQSFDRRGLFCLFWFAMLFAVIAILDPTSREPWIMALPPLIILFSVYIFEPLGRAGKRVTLLLFASALLLGNFFGGIGIMQSQAGDYYYARTAWLKENATPNDIILFGEQNDFRRPAIYLQYVLNMRLHIYPPIKGFAADEELSQKQFTQEIIDEAAAQNGRIYVLGDFFINDWSLLERSWRNEKRLARAKSFMERIRLNARLVDSGPLGSTFEIGAAKP